MMYCPISLAAIRVLSLAYLALASVGPQPWPQSQHSPEVYLRPIHDHAALELCEHPKHLKE